MTTQPYRPPYEIFAKARDLTMQAIFQVTRANRFEDAVIVPAVLSVAADLSSLSESTDAEIIEQFRHALLDARTRDLQTKPAN
jgi:hypothetical protein